MRVAFLFSIFCNHPSNYSNHSNKPKELKVENVAIVERVDELATEYWQIEELLILYS
jgi:hypothetical protein